MDYKNYISITNNTEAKPKTHEDFIKLGLEVLSIQDSIYLTHFVIFFSFKLQTRVPGHGNLYTKLSK